MRVLVCVVLLLLVSAGRAAEDKVADKNGELFTKRIQPVLKRHCYECHSAEADEVKGDLRLDTREGILKGGNNGPLFKDADVENSFLLKVLRYEVDDYQMPPRGKLPDEIVTDFEKWIQAGGVMPKK